MDCRVGGTSKIADSEEQKTAFTVGADYERRFGEFYGIGLAVDAAFGDFERDFLLLLTLNAHPTRSWKLLVAPGAEIGQSKNTWVYGLALGVGF